MMTDRGSLGPSAECGGSIPVVYVVDDDVSVRASLEMQIRGEGWRPEIFASTAAFLQRRRIAAPSCVVLDARLSSLCCLAVQQQIVGERPDMPIILIADCAEVAMTGQAGNGAEFLMKASNGQALLCALRWGVAQSTRALERETALQTLRERYGRLNPDQLRVMALVVAGRSNKQISQALGVSDKECRRIMDAMGAQSRDDLAQMADQLRGAAPRDVTPSAAKASIGVLAPWQLRRAQDLLAARLAGPIDIAAIAAQCGLSPGYFERAFARSTGKPPHRWLRERRVERSKELLMTSSLSIAEITLECGFADQSHLTRVFSATVGMSPGRWRRMNKH